jgi:TonB family protein
MRAGVTTLFVSALCTMTLGPMVQQAESPFVLMVRRTPTGVELTCERGCAWKALTLPCEPQANCAAKIDDRGMTRTDAVDTAPTELPPGVYRPGVGIRYPGVIKEVKPSYTPEAMKRKISGSVTVECVVLTDGTVGNARVSKSLDPTYGLDEEALKAAKQWRFTPGMKDGKAVPVLVSIELSFYLGK